MASEWRDPDRVAEYLEKADEFPRRIEGESVLLEVIPRGVERILDLGTGDGRLITYLRTALPSVHAVGVDFSEVMLESARRRFEGDDRIALVHHDMRDSLPDLGAFDAVVSSMAIHHLEDERKRELFAEVFDLLEPGGAFANFEHVASPSDRLHAEFFEAIGEPLENEDPSDRTAPVEVQLNWLREAAFVDVDCLWKWREMALLTGRRPSWP